MEVNRFGANHCLFLSTIFLLSVLCFELVFATYDLPRSMLTAMVLLISIVSTFTLDQLSYFHVLRPHPRKSDILIVALVVPSITLIVSAFTFFHYEVELTAILLPLLGASFALSLVTFLIDYLFCRFVGVDKRRKTIVLCLTPIESIRFIRRLSQLGMANYLRFLSYEEFLARAHLGQLANQAELVVWSEEAKSGDHETQCLIRSHLAGVPIHHYQKLLDSISGRIDLESFNLWMYLSRAKPQTGGIQLSWRVKEFLEPFFALFLMIALFPLMMCIAIAIRLSSRGPVVFRQKRTGMNGKIFTLYKFRTMVSDAEKDGPQWSSSSDSRITSLGKVLRKTRIDEFPQLLNVLKGEMSFCGPRPERPEMYSELEKEIEHFWLRTLVKPGITGWAQIQAGYAASVEESRKKLEYDLFYIQNMSPRLDLVIVLHTVFYALGFHKPHEQRDQEQGAVFSFRNSEDRTIQEAA